MTDTRLTPDDPREWLNRARSNLALARGGVEGVYLEDLCFDAQQAAEKALKGVLIHSRIRFPLVHDLAALVSLLETAGVTVPIDILQVARLTRYAVPARYPWVSESVTRDEYREALALAESGVRWAEAAIGNVAAGQQGA